MQRETTADQLVKVIQVLQLGRKTGTLTVERGEGGAFEEGSLVFVNGRVTNATTGHHTGLEALDYLNTWGQCKFAFIAQSAEKYTPPPTLTDTEPSLFADEQFLTPTTRPLPATRPLPIPLPPLQQEAGQHTQPLVSVIPIQTRPVDESLRLIAKARLSRTHKHVFLLINGHRTVTELAQLTRHEPIKLSAILEELESVGVIRH